MLTRIAPELVPDRPTRIRPAKVEIASERLLLREFVPSDFEPVHRFAAEPDFVRHTDWGPNDPDDTRAFLASAISDSKTDLRLRYAFALI